MALQLAFTGSSDRERLLALGDVDQRERDAVEQAKARRAARPSVCISHATCGHRVRWTGRIVDGELILGTGCWVHITDEQTGALLPADPQSVLA